MNETLTPFVFVYFLINTVIMAVLICDDNMHYRKDPTKINFQMFLVMLLGLPIIFFSFILNLIKAIIQKIKGKEMM